MPIMVKNRIQKTGNSLFFLFFLFPAFVSAGELHLTSEIYKYNITPIVHYLIDSKGDMSFEDIRQADNDGRFIENNKNSLSFGFSEESYWISFTLTGETLSEFEWFLELGYPAIDLYKIYIPDKSGQYVIKQIGDRVPFANWDVPFFKPTIPMGQELPIDKPVYINIRTTGVVNIAIALLYSPQFQEHIASINMGLGIYYGIMIALVIFNLFVYLSVRDTNYLLYVCFILSYTIAQFTYNGLGYQYLWPSGNWFANFSYTFFLSILHIFMILFVQSFFQIKKCLPKVNLFLNCLIGIFTFTSVSNLFFSMKIVSTATAFSGLITAFFICFTAVYSFLKGVRSARFFILSWGIFIVGFVTIIFKVLGIFPHNFFTEYSIQIGSAIQGLLLSLALADRINILKKEKEIAQIKALDETKKSETIKTQFLQKAEKLVEQRTHELLKAKNKLEKLARIDSLTSLYNRRVFDEVYEKEFSLAQRTGNDFSLLIIDIDFFKKFNDRYGHKKGDECLQAISSCMQKNAQRVTDTLARYGGEEFAVIMTDTNTENALIIAERIRKGVEELSIPHEDYAFGKVTISLGLASLSRGIEISHAQLFEKADNALYKAKEAGRNKIIISS